MSRHTLYVGIYGKAALTGGLSISVLTMRAARRPPARAAGIVMTGLIAKVWGDEITVEPRG